MNVFQGLKKDNLFQVFYLSAMLLLFPEYFLKFYLQGFWIRSFFQFHIGIELLPSPALHPFCGNIVPGRGDRTKEIKLQMEFGIFLKNTFYQYRRFIHQHLLANRVVISKIAFRHFL